MTDPHNNLTDWQMIQIIFGLAFAIAMIMMILE